VINVGGRDLTVVGVMPPDFAIRDAQVDVWTVIGLPPEARTPRGRGTHAIGRLKPGVSVAQAQADMTAIAAALTREYPAFNAGWTVNVVPLQEDMVGRMRTPLLVLFGAIALVLLIACANVANLLLAQASGRQRELAVRMALGGTRVRLVRQLLVESTTLALAGGLVGTTLAWTGIRLLRAFPLERLPVPRLAEVTLDAPVAFFALGVALLTGVVFGAMPALTASAVNLHDTLKEGTRGAGVRRGASTRALLVTAEIALSVVLLTGAGLLIRSFIRVMQTPLGFETTHLLTAQVNLPAGAYREDHERVAFFEGLLEDIRTLPGRYDRRRDHVPSAHRDSRRHQLPRRRQAHARLRRRTGHRRAGDRRRLLRGDAHSASARTHVRQFRRPTGVTDAHRQRSTRPHDVAGRGSNRQTAQHQLG
jgi:putative ABC transport system permease protein